MYQGSNRTNGGELAPEVAVERATGVELAPEVLFSVLILAYSMISL